MKTRVRDTVLLIGNRLAASVLTEVEASAITVGLKVERFPEQESISALKARAEQLAAVLLSPDLERPLALATELSSAAPDVKLVFLTDDGSSDASPFTLRSPAGSTWVVTAARKGSLQAVLGRTLDLTAFQDHADASDALLEAQRFLVATLNTLTAHIVVLDDEGIIIAANKAWHRFAENNHAAPGSIGIGMNYLGVCDGASGSDAGEAPSVAAGIRAVLQGAQESFTLEYPCHAPHERRWFILRANRLMDEGPVRVVVTHENISERKHAERALEEANEDLERRVQERTEALLASNARLEAEVAERKRRERVLLRSERYLGRAQEVAHVGNWEWQPETGAFQLSDELYRIYGLALHSHVRYEDYLTLLHPDDRPQVERAVREALEQETSFSFIERICRPDGQERIVLTAGETERDEGGTLWLLGVCHDLTDATHAQQALEASNRTLKEHSNELERLYGELETFSYTVSHDLRAPLRSIDGFAHALLEDYGETLDEVGMGYLTRIRRNTRRMGALIDDLLELARLSRNPLKREKIDLSALAARVSEDQAARFTVQPGLSAHADAKLVRIILENLFSNALKFSQHNPEAHILFGECKKGVYFVQDNGVGFSMDYAERIFGAFQRLHTPQEFEGSGIGLATVARIIQRHGGKIWAEAAPGKGATFYFTLGGSDET